MELSPDPREEPAQGHRAFQAPERLGDGSAGLSGCWVRRLFRAAVGSEFGARVHGSLGAGGQTRAHVFLGRRARRTARSGTLVEQERNEKARLHATPPLNPGTVGALC